MQSDMGKLFIGGIFWDTTEERLKEYFGNYGEILEAVIMKDRSTGRARGFGFVVFADPTVAERVVKEKHNIDGRMVEAKRAIPRDDYNSVTTRTTSTIQGSPGPIRTKKIFVGGLASTITETEFKSYFEKFGNITDAVVMYDHNTQRPRGFGFITFDSEESVEKVLFKTFHELNGKMVEVKKAVPKELSPSPSRSPISDLLNGYNPLVGYGLGFDNRFSPISSGRNSFGALEKSYQMGLNSNFEPGGNPYFIDNLNRVENSYFSSGPRNLWGNNSNNLINSVPISHLRGGVSNISQMGNHGYRQSVRPIGPRSSSYDQSDNGHDRAFTGSVYRDATWRLANLERDESGSFGYGLGSGVFDGVGETSPRFFEGYNMVRDR